MILQWWTVFYRDRGTIGGGGRILRMGRGLSADPAVTYHAQQRDGDVAGVVTKVNRGEGHERELR